MEHDGAAAIRKGTRITDPGLNEAFRDGAGIGVPEPGEWTYILERWFEGSRIGAKIYGVDSMPSMLRDAHDHLQMGVGAEVTISCVPKNTGLAHVFEQKTQKPLSQRNDEEIVDAELVSDD